MKEKICKILDVIIILIFVVVTLFAAYNLLSPYIYLKNKNTREVTDTNEFFDVKMALYRYQTVITGNDLRFVNQTRTDFNKINKKTYANLKKYLDNNKVNIETGPTVYKIHYKTNGIYEIEYTCESNNLYDDVTRDKAIIKIDKKNKKFKIIYDSLTERMSKEV